MSSSGKLPFLWCMGWPTYVWGRFEWHLALVCESWLFKPACVSQYLKQLLCVEFSSKESHSGYNTETAPLFLYLSSNTGLRQRDSNIYPLGGQKGSLVMTQEKTNTLTGCPQGTERGLTSRGGLAPALLFGPPLCRNYLKPLCPHVGLAHIPVTLGKQGEKPMWRSIKALGSRGGTGHN